MSKNEILYVKDVAAKQRKFIVCFQFEELVLYISILLVVLLAYGISVQALMFPSRDFYPGIFRDIFYYPYWQIYGELWLEELEGN